MIKINETAKISPNCDIEDSTRGSSIEAGAIVLIAIAILVLRFRNSSIVGLDKKKKTSKK